MSDSFKLRKTQGNLWLALSFFMFTLAVCGIWFVVVLKFGWSSIFIGVVPFVIGILSTIPANNAYTTYVGVSEKGINQCDAAKLKKLNGIIELVSAFVFLALAISSIWVFFIFSEFFLEIYPVCVIIFAVFIAFFISNIIVACDNFMQIKALVLKQCK